MEGWSVGVLECWVSETLVGFVPEGRYEGSLARSAWKNGETAPVPEGRYVEVPSASFIGWIMFGAIVRGQMPELNCPISTSNPADAGCNSYFAQYSHTPILHHSAWPDSRTACPTKPELCIVDRLCRPRKRGALHNQDVGEVGRTRTKRLVRHEVFYP
jgi:hypothetical protein